MSGPWVLPVSDGYYEYAHPKDLLFPGVGAEELSAAGVPADPWRSWKSPYTPTLIRTRDAAVLVDAGAGDVLETTGRLVMSLEGRGVRPEDVDLIIVTHLHPDHVCGLWTRDGGSVFPKARILLSDREYAYWRDEPDLLGLAVPQEAREMIRMIAARFLTRYADRLETVPMDARITPHIRLFPAPGHTPGHIGVEVSTDGVPVLIVGDAFLHPAHLRRPEWSAAVDVAPDDAVRTRRRILDRMREESAQLLGFHLPPPETE